jgi:hypothetical protein
MSLVRKAMDMNNNQLWEKGARHSVTSYMSPRLLFHDGEHSKCSTANHKRGTHLCPPLLKALPLAEGRLMAAAIVNLNSLIEEAKPACARQPGNKKMSHFSAISQYTSTSSSQAGRMAFSAIYCHASQRP